MLDNLLQCWTNLKVKLLCLSGISIILVCAPCLIFSLGTFGKSLAPSLHLPSGINIHQSSTVGSMGTEAVLE